MDGKEDGMSNLITYTFFLFASEGRVRFVYSHLMLLAYRMWHENSFQFRDANRNFGVLYVVQLVDTVFPKIRIGSFAFWKGVSEKSYEKPVA